MCMCLLICHRIPLVSPWFCSACGDSAPWLWLPPSWCAGCRPVAQHAWQGEGCSPQPPQEMTCHVASRPSASICGTMLCCPSGVGHLVARSGCVVTTGPATGTQADPCACCECFILIVFSVFRLVCVFTAATHFVFHFLGWVFCLLIERPKNILIDGSSCSLWSSKQMHWFHAVATATSNINCYSISSRVKWKKKTHWLSVHHFDCAHIFIQKESYRCMKCDHFV